MCHTGRKGLFLADISHVCMCAFMGMQVYQSTVSQMTELPKPAGETKHWHFWRRRDGQLYCYLGCCHVLNGDGFLGQSYNPVGGTTAP